ncbi:MAG: aspartate-semialdehyde dehydrogenase [Clostridiales bacterium]|nr:MAG: aspartate-semialdehyde dehydrogenase [Clostridiales bacterium]
MNKKLKAGIIGATGMVGQRFITLLNNHPMFEISVLAASSRSAGKKYEDAVAGKWKMTEEIPDSVKEMVVYDAADVKTVSSMCDFTFCAVDMKKDEIRALEEAYAKAETPVVSNNSANRSMSDVPMVIPEINPDHIKIIDEQKKRLGTTRGFIAVKPNCSIQSYVPLLTPLKEYGIKEVVVCTYQAISGAGKTFNEWPEMVDNVIPYIGGEEEKSENEPLKIWGEIKDGAIVPAVSPVITTQCIRVPVSDGHTAAVFVKFDKKPSKEEILSAWKSFGNGLGLPSSPEQFIHYFEEDNRPQAKLDRNSDKGMAIFAGRLREDKVYDYKFVGLSHNTLRGAAGGGVLIAEFLASKGYIAAK